MWDGRKDGLPSPRVPLIYVNFPRLERRNLAGFAADARAAAPVRAITAGETRYRAFSRSIAEL